jgi:hypothetical protein
MSPRCCSVDEGRLQRGESLGFDGRMHESCSRESFDLGSKRVLVYLAGEDHNGRGIGVDSVLEPAHPLVGDPEVDNLCRDRTDTGADADTGDPTDRSTDDQAQQTCPHRAGERGTTGLRIDRFLDADVVVGIFDDKYGVDQVQLVVASEVIDGEHELPRATLRIE